MPPKDIKEALHRMICSIFSSFIGTTFFLIYSHQTGWIVDSAMDMSGEWYGNPKIGFALVFYCSIIICAIPGWWIMSGITKWMDKNSEKVISKVLNKASKNEE